MKKYEIYVILKNGKTCWVEREGTLQANKTFNKIKNRDDVEGVQLTYWDGKERNVLETHWN